MHRFNAGIAQGRLTAGAHAGHSRARKSAAGEILNVWKIGAMSVFLRASIVRVSSRDRIIADMHWIFVSRPPSNSKEQDRACETAIATCGPLWSWLDSSPL